MNIPEAMKFIENDIKMALDMKKTVDPDDHMEELNGFIYAHRLAYRALQEMRVKENERSDC